MATETPPQVPAAPDLAQVPNFTALEGWVGKLQTWCKAAAKEIELLNKEAEDLRGRQSDAQDKLDEAEKELQAFTDLAHDFNGLVEFVNDVERRVRTGPELFDYMRRNGWMR
jgi:predicted  nucleic acid-binding Zn-ribbon protein